MDYYLSGNAADGNRLVISPLNADFAAAHNIDDSEFGYYLYSASNTNVDRVTILAKLASEDAAFEMGRLLGLT